MADGKEALMAEPMERGQADSLDYQKVAVKESLKACWMAEQ